MATIIKRTAATNSAAQTLSTGYSLRKARAAIVEGIRPTVYIRINAYGQPDVKQISLGNRGDNRVTYVQFNTEEIQNIGARLSDYSVKLYIHNPKLPKNNINPIAVEPFVEPTPASSLFLLDSEWFSGAGEYELLLAFIENTSAEGNVDTQVEVFLSDVIKGTLNDTGIHGDFVSLLPDATTIDGDYNTYLQKPFLNAMLQNDHLTIDGINNVNRWDAFSTYLRLENFPEALEDFYLVYSVQDSNMYGAVKFYYDEEGVGGYYKTWLPKAWTNTDAQIKAWIIGTATTNGEIYVSNSFSFQTKSNFLVKEDWETTLLESGQLKLLDAEKSALLVIPENIGGTYQLSYTGSEIDDILNYVENLREGGSGEVLPEIQIQQNTANIAQHTEQITQITNDVSAVQSAIYNSSYGTYTVDASVNTKYDLPNTPVEGARYYVKNTNTIYEGRDGVYVVVDSAIITINGGGAN